MRFLHVHVLIDLFVNAKTYTYGKGQFNSLFFFVQSGISLLKMETFSKGFKLIFFLFFQIILTVSINKM